MLPTDPTQSLPPEDDRFPPTKSFNEGGSTIGFESSTAAPVPLIAERYELGEEIDRGGMGIVHHARDRVLNRDVAVKILQPRFAPDSSTARRFVEEAKIAGQLQHPGIAPVHDLGMLPGGQPYLAMKLIKGQTLAKLLADKSHSLDAMIDHFGEIVRTVAYAHHKGVIHRDLKPANVMIGAFGEVQVMDWGLAKLIAGTRTGIEPAASDAISQASVIETDRTPDSATQAGSILGTPAYMPPEQAKGDMERIDARADVFALGSMLCELLTGKPAYTGTFDEIRARSIIGDLKPAQDRLAACQVDPALRQLALDCLKADPANRPKNAHVVSQRLTDFRQATAAKLKEAEQDKLKAEISLAEQRKRRIVWAGLAAALAIGTAISLYFATRATNYARKIDESYAELKAEQSQRQKEFERAEEETRVAKAEKARADQQLARAERLNYVNELQNADRHWNQFNISSAVNLLNATSWDQRGSEWNLMYHMQKQSEIIHFSEYARPNLSPNLNKIIYRDTRGEIKIGIFNDDILGKALPINFAENRWDTRVFWDNLGKHVAISGKNKISIFSCEHYKEIASVETLGEIYGFVWMPNGISFALTYKDHSLGSNIFIHSIFEPRKVKTIPLTHRKQVVDINIEVLFNDNLLCCDRNGNVVAVNTETSEVKLLYKFSLGNNYIQRISLSPDKNRIAYCSGRVLSIIDRMTGLEAARHTLAEIDSDVEQLAWSPDGIHVAIGCSDGRVVVLPSWPDDEERFTFRGHSQNVRQLLWVPNSHYLVSTSDDGSVRFWAIPDEKYKLPDYSTASWGYPYRLLVSREKNISSKIDDCKFLQDHKALLCHAIDWNRPTSHWSADRKRIAILPEYSAKSFRILEVQSGGLLGSWSGESDVSAFAWSKDGRYLAFATDDKIIRYWELYENSFREIRQEKMDSYVRSLLFANDYQNIISSSSDGLFCHSIFDSSKHLICETGFHAFELHGFVPEDRYLICSKVNSGASVNAFVDGEIIYINIDTGISIAKSRDQMVGSISSSLITRDGRFITLSLNGLLQIWNRNDCGLLLSCDFAKFHSFSQFDGVTDLALDDDQLVIILGSDTQKRFSICVPDRIQVELNFHADDARFSKDGLSIYVKRDRPPMAEISAKTGRMIGSRNDSDIDWENYSKISPDGLHQLVVQNGKVFRDYIDRKDVDNRSHDFFQEITHFDADWHRDRFHLSFYTNQPYAAKFHLKALYNANPMDWETIVNLAASDRIVAAAEFGRKAKRFEEMDDY
jgi:serine/threonine protein kinase